jgi:hypothetical protein
MKRRGFFTAIAGAAAGGVAGAAVTKKEVKEPLILPDVVHYNGFTINWTGWKYSANQLQPCGQWIARPDDEQPIITSDRPWGYDGIYSSFPGGVRFFVTGDMFDIDWSVQQWEIDHDKRWYEDPKKLVRAQRFALQSIKKFINENC